MRRLPPRPRALLVVAAAGLLLGAPDLADPASAAPRTLGATLQGSFARASRASGAYVVDVGTGRVLFARQSRVRRIPASVQKLFTTTAALERLGPEATFVTRALAAGTLDPDGILAGDLVLKGGGDPTFGTTAFVLRRYPGMGGATVEALADALVARGLRGVSGGVVADETLFDPLRGGPSSGYLTSWDVGPLGALTLDRGILGRRFSRAPALTAADALARALRARGVVVAGHAGVGAAPLDAVELAAASSPTLAALVRQVNLQSDNFFAETLLKDVGAHVTGSGTTATGADLVRQTAEARGSWPRVRDGSGLSRANGVSPYSVVRLLTSLDGTPTGTVVRGSLPVAGRTGTLSTRLRRTVAQGRCQAKTGTLRDVSSLAGYCRSRSGRTLAFAFMMNRTSPARARAIQDRMAVALAGWRGVPAPVAAAPPAP